VECNPLQLHQFNFQNGVNSKTEISRVLEKNRLDIKKVPGNQASYERLSDNSWIPHGGDGNSSQPNRVHSGSKAKVLLEFFFTRRFQNCLVVNLDLDEFSSIGRI
jgi:hypothetical protein